MPSKSPYAIVPTGNLLSEGCLGNEEEEGGEREGQEVFQRMHSEAAPAGFITDATG